MITTVPATSLADPREAALLAALEAQSGRHYALARRMLGDDQEAHDAVQEAWLRAWRHRRRLRDDDAVNAWLSQIVVRECYRSLRWRSARSWLSFGADELELPDPTPGTDAVVAAHRRRERIRFAARVLSPKQRLVWGLRFDEGWTVAEIAESTGLTRDTIKTHLGRALAKVRAEIGRQHGL